MTRSARGMLLAIATVVIATVALMACSSSSKHTAVPSSTAAPATSSSSGATITIQNFSFHPSTLTVEPGTTVTVRNADSATHTVTDHGKFDTGDVAPGQTKTFTAPSAPGTYPYICTIHQFMHGTLVVS